MKTFMTLALALVLTAGCLVGCGCTNQKMDNTSAPTVLPTNEEIWNTTETVAPTTTETTGTTHATDGTAATDSVTPTGSINETEVQNHVNAHTEMMDKIRENENAGRAADPNVRRSMPGSR